MKKKQTENFLDKIPCHKKSLKWSQDLNGIVTLEMKNTGFANRVAQKLFKMPKTSFIHLEKFGSFVWLTIDGERDLTVIGKLVKEHFGEKAEPVYERLAQYIKTLQGNGFITIF